MRKTAFIYPGQGVQKSGMGKAFYERSREFRDVFDMAEDTLGFSVSELCFEENSKINETEYTQAAIVTNCLAITKEIQALGINPAAAAGLSLGEYAAVAVSGACSVSEILQTVYQRGVYMQDACSGFSGSMYTVTGLEAEYVEQLLKDIDGVSIATYLCPGRTVITGETERAGKAVSLLLENGAKRCIPLNVAYPFHSFLLKEAADRLERFLGNVEFADPSVPYVSNVTAEYVSCRKMIKKLLVRHVTEPVRFEQCIRTMLADGVDTMIDIGSDGMLARCIRHISPSVNVISIDVPSDLQQLENLR